MWINARSIGNDAEPLCNHAQAAAGTLSAADNTRPLMRVAAACSRMAAPTAVLGQLPIRPTVAFECVGAPGLFQQLINGVPAGTRIVVAGISIGTDHFEPAQGVLKELDIRFSLCYTPEQFAETFTHLAAGDLDVAALLTRTVGLDGVADAFARPGTSPHDAKILLDPTRRANRTLKGRRHVRRIPASRGGPQHGVSQTLAY